MRFVIIFIVLISTLYAKNEFKVIAFAQDTLANDFRKAQVNEVQEEIAKHSNIKFVYSNAQAKTSLLIYQIEKFIKAKVDLLIIGTNDADAVVPVVSKAYKSGIPVIILDRGINSDIYTTFINSDNIKIGKIGAQYIAKKIGYRGSVLLLEGLLKADVTQLRSKGFMDEMAKYKDIRVIKRTANYLRADAIREMEGIIKDGIEIDAVFAQSDSMISGARSAMRRFKIDPSSIIMVGCDYTSEAQKEIRKGDQTASIKFPLAGKEAVGYAIDIFNGKTLAKHISIPVSLVTKNNVESTQPIF